MLVGGRPFAKRHQTGYDRRPPTIIDAAVPFHVHAVAHTDNVRGATWMLASAVVFSSGSALIKTRYILFREASINKTPTPLVRE